MTWWEWILVGLVVWTCVGFIVAPIVGRWIARGGVR